MLNLVVAQVMSSSTLAAESWSDRHVGELRQLAPQPCRTVSRGAVVMAHAVSEMVRRTARWIRDELAAGPYSRRS
jgi:hypothetical protein